MNLTEKLTIAALAGGPILSVIVGIFLTRWLENRRESRQRKFVLFKTLMATRAINLSPSHVEALNSIDVVFADEAEVASAWRKMIAHLNAVNNDTTDNHPWGDKRIELLFQMLQKMAVVLGYKIDETQIKAAGYNPIAHGSIETQLGAIRQYIVDLSEGKKSVPISDTHPKVSER